VFDELQAQTNKFIVDELNYDKDKECQLHKSLLEKLTDEQYGVYSTIMKSVETQDGQFCFLYGYGGKYLYVEDTIRGHQITR